MYLSITLYLSIFLASYLSIHPSINQSIYLFLSIYLFAYGEPTPHFSPRKKRLQILATGPAQGHLAEETFQAGDLGGAFMAL